MREFLNFLRELCFYRGKEKKGVVKKNFIRKKEDFMDFYIVLNKKMRSLRGISIELKKGMIFGIGENKVFF